MNNTHKTLPSGIIARRYRIIGTDHFEYEALRPTAGGQYSGYTSFSRVGNGVLCGVVGTESLPADLDALPAYSQGRLESVKAWQAARNEEACQAILEAFPESAEGTRSSHGISLTVPQALIDLGRQIAQAIEHGDKERLETLCLRGKVYSKVRKAALYGGVSAERLEEALEEIS